MSNESRFEWRGLQTLGVGFCAIAFAATKSRRLKPAPLRPAKMCARLVRFLSSTGDHDDH
jgi:hypothetical protein